MFWGSGLGAWGFDGFYEVLFRETTWALEYHTLIILFS